MKIIVGLGNIGTKYAKTRHNCGFLVLDEFTKQLEKADISVEWKEESKLKAFTAKVKFENQQLLLVKPTTLMNGSGEAVSKILHFFKEPLENLVVIYDDIDLPLGTIRTREKGSAGTHNGMRSIIEHLGKEEFARIRIGIESRGEIMHKSIDLTDFVLGEFTAEEYPLIKESLEQAAEELIKLIKN
ncbi:MAG: aminoacyl-tRNA hydrolase [Candidatus Gracilibacteria bacterium]|jgi:PTH1 family peptidyl-tRNA hydrolase